MHELLLDQPELLLRLLQLFLKLFEIGVELLLVELVFLVCVPKAEAGDDAAGNGDERSAKPGDDDPGGRCEASVLVADPVVLEDPGPLQERGGEDDRSRGPSGPCQLALRLRFHGGMMADCGVMYAVIDRTQMAAVNRHLLWGNSCKRRAR
ncbi:hypothetical protein [Streptomyces sp. NPDC002855]|uniref:hypothetical protein n=1 Tax=Streptomyces sp. NPDC002855 TaxID=3154437 RepID=UPI0033187A9B